MFHKSLQIIEQVFLHKCYFTTNLHHLISTSSDSFIRLLLMKIRSLVPAKAVVVLRCGQMPSEAGLRQDVLYEQARRLNFSCHKTHPVAKLEPKQLSLYNKRTM